MWSLDDSRCGGAAHLETITLPALVVSATGDTGVYPSDAAGIFEALASRDKQMLELPGDHYFRGTDGERDRVADVLAEWVGDRS